MRYYLGLISLLSIQHATAVPPNIKVLIAKHKSRVQISGLDVDRSIWPKDSHRTFVGERRFDFNCKSKRVGARSIPLKLASLTSKTGMLKTEGGRYRGKLHVQTSENNQGCDVVNEISLEEYLESLLAKEMHNSWPAEALKAQAVAARSYAFYKIKTKEVAKTKGFETFYDLENSEKHQVSGSFFDVTQSTFKAVRETAGEMLFASNGELTPIFFHSKCGGRTLTPGQVWSNEVNGYSSVDCPYCHKHGMKPWDGNIDLARLTEGLKTALHRFRGIRASGKTIRLIEDKRTDSHLKFYLGDEFHVLKKSRLRGTLGRNTLPSNYFNLTVKDNAISYQGTGFGHGVGMCQFGAKELALRGYNYKQILNHYFPQLVLRKKY